jgi:hypothetical protein
MELRHAHEAHSSTRQASAFQISLPRRNERPVWIWKSLTELLARWLCSEKKRLAENSRCLPANRGNSGFMRRNPPGFRKDVRGFSEPVQQAKDGRCMAFSRRRSEKALHSAHHAASLAP